MKEEKSWYVCEGCKCELIEGMYVYSCECDWVCCHNCKVRKEQQQKNQQHQQQRRRQQQQHNATTNITNMTNIHY